MTDEPHAGDTCEKCHEGRLKREDDAPPGPRIECDNCGAFWPVPPKHDRWN